MTDRISNSEAARLWRLRPDTLRKIVRDKGNFVGVTPTKDQDSGEYAWSLSEVLASLPDADMSPAQREAWDSLEACVGTLSVAPASRAQLLGLFHSLPFDQRHDSARVLAQADAARRILDALDRLELTSCVDHGTYVTRLSPAVQVRLADVLGSVAEHALRISARVRSTAQAMQDAEGDSQ